jgi:hypothetical protein
VPLRDAAPTTLVLAVHREIRHPIIDEFVELAGEIAANATRNPGTGYAAPYSPADPKEEHERAAAST